MSADWLRDAVIYEIYPQSYADSDGDGIGDLRGVIDRLDYIASLGIDAIWFNPCFASPFLDAGYDVADYLTVAPRYGTNDDLVELVAKARERGIRVLLDLVVGHTSTAHVWFQEELAAAGPNPAGDRFIWRTDPPDSGWGIDLPGIPAWVRSPGPRPGWYLKNFYDTQPALNFGWVRPDAALPWRAGVDAPGPRRNREALREILDFWLSKGVAGFRVDMAFSLVKDEFVAEGRLESVAIWREIRGWMESAYPEAVLIPEGEEPRDGRVFAFDADFALVIHEAHASLFDNHGAGALPWHTPREPFFDAAGQGSTEVFLRMWDQWRAADDQRPVILASADHDFSRLRCGARTPEQLGAALTLLFTWGSIPSLYYGDEIGMRYLPGMPNVEGAVCHPAYNRAGCRTPMQWDDGPNAGFSDADPADLYLPVDPAPDRPTVAAQDGVGGSTLTLVRELLALRRATPALQGRAPTRVVNAGYPFAWTRGESHLVVVNPRAEAAALEDARAGSGRLIWGSGARTRPGGLDLDGFGYGIIEI
jgi:glycosidase